MQQKLNGISFIEALFRSGLNLLKKYGLKAQYCHQGQNYKGIKGVDKMFGTRYSEIASKAPRQNPLKIKQ